MVFINRFINTVNNYSTSEEIRMHKIDRTCNLCKLNQLESRDKVISELIHDLIQPITIIHTYIIGCIYRLSENKEENVELLDILNTVKEHSVKLGHKIHELKHLLALTLTDSLL